LLLAMPAAAQDFGKGLEAYQRGDYAAALREWRPLAGQGDAAAQYKLGALYDDGQGVPQDHAEAMRWYRKAAKQGYAIVAYTIGDYQGAARLYRELAEQGDVEAQDRLGSMYNRGMGVPEDYAEAAKWYRKAAEQGYASAQYNLGNMYLSGDGVPQDYVQAYKWFILMLSQNDPPCGVQTASDQDQEQQDAMDYLCEQVRSLEAANRQQVREILRLLRSKKMTPAQIAEAQKLAREWLAEHGK
jgi:TPR repeat protein